MLSIVFFGQLLVDPAGHSCPVAPPWRFRRRRRGICAPGICPGGRAVGLPAGIVAYQALILNRDIQTLQPILRDNFRLTVHVPVMTAGYGGHSPSPSCPFRAAGIRPTPTRPAVTGSSTTTSVAERKAGRLRGFCRVHRAGGDGKAESERPTVIQLQRRVEMPLVAGIAALVRRGGRRQRVAQGKMGLAADRQSGGHLQVSQLPYLLFATLGYSRRRIDRFRTRASTGSRRRYSRCWRNPITTPAGSKRNSITSPINTGEAMTIKTDQAMQLTGEAFMGLY